MERRSIDLPAGTIHYRESGPADGRPVVFVHGFLVDDTLWSDVPERLAEAGFHTYRADLAAGLAHDRDEARRRPVAARGGPGRRELPGGARTCRTWSWSAATPGERCRSCCSTRTGAGWVGWC